MDKNKEPFIVMMKGSENGGCAFGNEVAQTDDTVIVESNSYLRFSQ